MTKKEIKTNITISIPASLYEIYLDKYGDRQLSGHVEDKINELLGKKHKEQTITEEFINLPTEVKLAVNDLLAELQNLNLYEGLEVAIFYNDVLKVNLQPLEVISKDNLGVLSALFRYKKAVKK